MADIMAIEYGYYLAISEEGVVMTRLACAFTGTDLKNFLGDTMKMTPAAND